MQESLTPQGSSFRFLLILPVLAVTAALLIANYPPPGAVDRSVVIAALQADIAPEPAETFTYAVLSILGLGLAIASGRFRISSDSRVTIAADLLLACSFGWLIANGEIARMLVRGYAAGFQRPTVALLLAAAAGVGTCYLSTYRRGLRFVWAVLAAVVLVHVCSWRVLGTTFADTDLLWPFHADPIFYGIAQVAAGKTVLVDLPSQYGLFSQFLGPLFRILPLSIFSVTLVFALLQVLATCALLWVLARRLRSAPLLLISGLALVMVVGENVLLFDGLREMYLQYWPIRFLWPACAVLVFDWYLERPTVHRTVVFSVLAGAGVLWNADSGMAVVLAFGAFLAARVVMGHDRRNNAIRLGVHLVTLAITVAATLITLRVAVGPLHLAWLFEYQQIFAGLGLLALPMPRMPHDWMAIAAVYLLALVAAAEGWRRGAGRRADLVFFLAILGIGLFAYYVSRSHILNLIKVAWPAVLITALLCDSCLRQSRSSFDSKFILAATGIGALALAAGSFVVHAVSAPPGSPQSIGSTFQQPTGSTFDEELALVRKHTSKGEECVIAARRQGVYHLASGTSSPVSGPGLTEALLSVDQERLVSEVMSGKQRCLFFGTGTQSSTALPITLDDLRKLYRVVDQSRGGTMFYLVPK
jgi:hypothetical protein